MAKNKAPSKHSRAARRATSPGINTDKSLKDVALPSKASRAAAAADRPSVLAVHRSAGVQKKAKPTRKGRLSARARRR
ncbi:Ribosome biogenesis protein Alb1, partial [Tolypocladium paradoxum]